MARVCELIPVFNNFQYGSDIRFNDFRLKLLYTFFSQLLVGVLISYFSIVKYLFQYPYPTASRKGLSSHFLPTYSTRISIRLYKHLARVPVYQFLQIFNKGSQAAVLVFKLRFSILTRIEELPVTGSYISFQ